MRRLNAFEVDWTGKLVSGLLDPHGCSSPALQWAIRHCRKLWLLMYTVKVLQLTLLTRRRLESCPAGTLGNIHFAEVRAPPGFAPAQLPGMQYAQKSDITDVILLRGGMDAS